MRVLNGIHGDHGRHINTDLVTSFETAVMRVGDKERCMVRAYFVGGGEGVDMEVHPMDFEQLISGDPLRALR
jgi:hypothetical protein